jgi:drug/metabolite transporter superfamily protein YnfA
MSDFLGLNPSAALAKSAAIKANLPTIDHLVWELTQTYNAALNPNSYGIDAGETTVAPWSVSTLLAARNELSAARSVVAEMADRIGAEVSAQQRVSGNASAIHGSAKGSLMKPGATGSGVTPGQPFDISSVLDFLTGVRRVRTFAFSLPGAILQLPAAVTLLVKAPSLWRYLTPPSTWFSLAAYAKGSKFLTDYANLSTNWFIRNGNRAAPYVKVDGLFNKVGLAVLDHADEAAKWLPAATKFVTEGSAFLKTAGVALGKGFGGLGAIMGGYNLGVGIAGAMDGEVSSEDAWAMADGAVGIVCGIGSLMPPPVGVVFAAVGGVYALGRFLFSPLDDGKTPMEHMGSFFTDVGTNVANFGADTAKNVAQAVNQAGQNVGAAVDAGIKTAQNAVKNTAKAIDDTLATAGKVFDAVWPW